MDTPTLSPAGVGSPLALPPLDISSMTDMVTELTRLVDRAQLDQDIEDFNISYPVNVDDALNLFSLPPVAGVGTAPGPPLPHHPSPRPPCQHDPARPPDTSRHCHHHSTHTVHQPTTTRHFHQDTSHYHRTCPSTCRSRDIYHHDDRDDTKYTSQNRCQTTTTTSRCVLTPVSSTVG